MYSSIQSSQQPQEDSATGLTLVAYQGYNDNVQKSLIDAITPPAGNYPAQTEEHKEMVLTMILDTEQAMLESVLDLFRSNKLGSAKITLDAHAEPVLGFDSYWELDERKQAYRSLWLRGTPVATVHPSAGPNDLSIKLVYDTERGDCYDPKMNTRKIQPEDKWSQNQAVRDNLHTYLVVRFGSQNDPSGAESAPTAPADETTLHSSTLDGSAWDRLALRTAMTLLATDANVRQSFQNQDEARKIAISKSFPALSVLAMCEAGTSEISLTHKNITFDASEDFDTLSRSLNPLIMAADRSTVSHGLARKFILVHNSGLEELHCTTTPDDQEMPLRGLYPDHSERATEWWSTGRGTEVASDYQSLLSASL